MIGKGLPRELVESLVLGVFIRKAVHREIVYWVILLVVGQLNQMTLEVFLNINDSIIL